jgi:hypothetical protein
MSLMKQGDVKNHLSARHRTEIHVARPESQSDPTGFPHEEPSGAEPEGKDSPKNPLNIPTPIAPNTTPIVTSKSVKP